jgi:predicted PurR-regulated permease PerM
MDRPPPQRVEVVVSARTLLVLLAVGGTVALVLLSLGTLLSVFVAAVLALGLDPVVGALVRRGWGRGRAGSQARSWGSWARSSPCRSPR